MAEIPNNQTGIDKDVAEALSRLQSGVITATELAAIKASIVADPSPWDDFFESAPEHVLPEELMMAWYAAKYDATPDSHPSWIQNLRLWLAFQRRSISEHGRLSGYLRQTFALPRLVVGMALIAVVVFVSGPDEEVMTMKGVQTFADKAILHRLIVQQLMAEGHLKTLAKNQALAIGDQLVFRLQAPRQGNLFLVRINGSHHEVFFPAAKTGVVYDVKKNNTLIQAAQGVLTYIVDSAMLGKNHFCSYLIDTSMDDHRVTKEQLIAALIATHDYTGNHCQMVTVP